jgi:hypothetical protein
MTSPYTPGTVPNPLNPAQVAGAIQGAVKTVAGVVPGANEAAGILDSVIAARRWMADRHNWIRVAWFVGGGMLLVGGALTLARKPISGIASNAGATPSKITSAVGAVK